MCVAHCDAVGYIALRGVIMNNEELALRIQQGEDAKKNMQQLYDQNYYLLRKTAKKYSNIDSMTDIGAEYEPLSVDVNLSNTLLMPVLRSVTYC